ncbi:unnamed protein product, partial [marine sediment metagenome]
MLKGRILGFCQKWPKLRRPTFTTFRVTRRDKDWQVGEEVQIVVRPRSKEREKLGRAVIIGKELRSLRSLVDVHHLPTDTLSITRAEAVADGFPSYKAMAEWLYETHGLGPNAHINKLTVSWKETLCLNHAGSP